MPSISLPTINIPEEGLKSKETMENILDTLVKYRKELNFLLMNLDLDNMPTIGGLLGDIDGNFSLISQTIDNITLSVGNVEGDISSLQLQADAIIASVSDANGNISALQLQATSIIASVSSNDGDIAALVITAQGIQTQVTNINSTVGTNTSSITQLSNSISSIVSFTDVTGNQIASKINQTATTISLSASKIDLTGITTLYDATDPDFYVRSSGRGLTFYDNGTAYLDLAYRDPVTARIYSDSALYIGDTGTSTYFEGNLRFNDDVVFNYNVDFLGADVEGIVACYYPTNWFYLDYGGGSQITVRSKTGTLVGYLDIV